MVLSRRYTLGEEIAHAITHGLGVGLSIAATVLLAVAAARHGDIWCVVAGGVFGGTLVLLYTASTMYHALPWNAAKRVFQKLDHAAIYVLIAGTYTPFTLVTLRGGWGWSLFGIVWGLAILGATLDLVLRRRRRWLSLTFYLSMGWLVAIAIRPLVRELPSPGLLLLFLGGLAYTGGVAFYVARRWRYHHAVWHVCVLAGSVLHFFAVYFYVLPRPA